MLEYLVTSKTRRKLLKLLWRDGENGTAAELANKSGVAFAGAYKELKAMTSSELANAEWKNGRKVFSANKSHPMAQLLNELVKESVEKKEVGEKESNSLRENLAFLGLPVSAHKTRPDPGTSIEALMAQAADLSQNDASVARSLPVLFHKLREKLDFETLKNESLKRGNRHQVGFFLELTGKLSRDEKLTRVSRNFLDHRFRVPRQFFKNESESEVAKQLAELRTPELAKKWGWRMNMGEDAFAKTYENFSREAVSA